MFKRIYWGTLLSVALATGLGYALQAWTHQQRWQDWQVRAMERPMRFINVSLSGANGARNRRYLDIVERLMGIEAHYFSLPDLPLSAAAAARLAAGELVGPLWQDEQLQWWMRVDHNTRVRLDFKDVGERQLRGFLLVLVAHWQRGKVDDVATLQPYLAWPLSKQAIDSLDIDSQQRSRLQRGALAVVYTPRDPPHFHVYAPLDSSDALALGPVPVFEPLPLWVVLLMVLLGALVVVAVSHVLVSQLERRLVRIGELVDRVGEGDLAARVDDPARDSIGHLARRINAMSERTMALLSSQRNILQAVSHELKTPLARLRFRLAELQELDEPAGSSAAVLRGVDRDIGELEQLVADTLEHHRLSRLDAIDARPQPLRAAVDAAIADLQPLHPLCRFDNRVATGVQLMTDSVMLRALLGNLLGNACKYGKNAVTVDAEVAADSAIELIVDDNGSGVDPAIVSSVFDPFFRADDSRSKTIDGVGLGLAIVDRIARLHGAAIDIERSPLGGARFRVRFPGALQRDDAE